MSVKKPTINERLPNQVAVYEQILTRLPFVITNKRDKNRNMRIEKLYSNGIKTTIMANEQITPTDIYVLIGAVKVFEDRTKMINSDVERSDLFKKPMIKVKIGIYDFLHNYTGLMNKEVFKDTLIRLASLQMTISKADGSQCQQRYLYDYDVSEKNKTVEFIISKAFYDLCTGSELWMLNWDKALKIKSQTGKALFLYLSKNSGNIFSQDFFENLLDMDNSNSADARDNRRQIKNALNEICAAEFINNFQYNSVTKNFEIIRPITSKKKAEIIKDTIVL